MLLGYLNLNFPTCKTELIVLTSHSCLEGKENHAGKTFSIAYFKRTTIIRYNYDYCECYYKFHKLRVFRIRFDNSLKNNQSQRQPISFNQNSKLIQPGPHKSIFIKLKLKRNKTLSQPWPVCSVVKVSAHAPKGPR